jgi:acyl-CoA thioester hydrolase
MHAPAFTQTRVVVDADIDELGHASNIAYIRWLQDVAVAHSASLGFDFEAYVKLGGVFVVRRQEVDYMRSVVRGDRVELRTWISTAMAAKSQRITMISDDRGLVARALTTWGYVEMATGRPARIPQVLRDAFGMTLRAETRSETE